MVKIYCACKSNHGGYISRESFKCYVDDALVEQVTGIDGTITITGASFSGRGAATLNIFLNFQ